MYTVGQYDCMDNVVGKSDIDTLMCLLGQGRVCVWLSPYTHNTVNVVLVGMLFRQ
jgi:hypothetical protein